MNWLKILLGSGFYSGFAPTAPGTAGSLLALVPIYFLIEMQNIWVIPLFILTTSLLLFWVSPYIEDLYGKDSSILVLDEWAGQALTFFTITISGTTQAPVIILLTGFILFRVFDILKPFGISKLEKLPGGWGVLTDDLLAGLYALVCLKTLILVFPKLFAMA